MTGKTTGGDATTLEYDASNRLTRIFDNVNTTEYVYNGGVLIEESVNGISKRYVVDRSRAVQQTLLEIDESGNPLASYVYGSNRISRKLAGETDYYHHDRLGSVRELTDSDGVVTSAFVYDAFGNVTQTSGTEPGNFGFTGEHFDADTGLVFLRNRFYDPQLGRFLSQDPASGAREAPVTLHRYLYAANNPGKFVDPTGAFFSLAQLTVGATIVAGLVAAGALANSAAVHFGGGHPLLWSANFEETDSYIFNSVWDQITSTADFSLLGGSFSGQQTVSKAQGFPVGARHTELLVQAGFDPFKLATIGEAVTGAIGATVFGTALTTEIAAVGEIPKRDGANAREAVYVMLGSALVGLAVLFEFQKEIGIGLSLGTSWLFGGDTTGQLDGLAVGASFGVNTGNFTGIVSLGSEISSDVGINTDGLVNNLLSGTGQEAWNGSSTIALSSSVSLGVSEAGFGFDFLIYWALRVPTFFPPTNTGSE